VVSVVLLSCQANGDAATVRPTPAVELAEPEGRLDLLVWPNYAENGVDDPAFDWVTPFEHATGCEVYPTEVNDSSAALIQQFESGNYDGVSASGDATGRLIADGAVAPLNLDLIPNYSRLFSGLQLLDHSTVDGVPYGVPHGRGANVLLYATAAFNPPPDSWRAIFEPDSPAAGRISVYDSAIFLAEAAVYLMRVRPELEITDPYALDDRQFSAVVDLLRVQRPMVGEYWRSPAQQIRSFGSGQMLAGTSWQSQASRLAAEEVPVSAVLPREGATGWSVTWMIGADAPHPGCMYRWLDWIISPRANAMATVWSGEAPVSPQACREAEALSPGHCEAYSAADEDFFSQIWYWRRPERVCGDERGAVCKDFEEWSRAWEEIKNMLPLPTGAPSAPG